MKKNPFHSEDYGSFKHISR